MRRSAHACAKTVECLAGLRSVLCIFNTMKFIIVLGESRNGNCDGAIKICTFGRHLAVLAGLQGNRSRGSEDGR
jgi:hypothetical protein